MDRSRGPLCEAESEAPARVLERRGFVVSKLPTVDEAFYKLKEIAAATDKNNLKNDLTHIVRRSAGRTRRQQASDRHPRTPEQCSTAAALTGKDYRVGRPREIALIRGS